MDSFNKDFSDDSLMINNEIGSEIPYTGPALTSASSDNSPYLNMSVTDQQQGGESKGGDTGIIGQDSDTQDKQKDTVEEVDAKSNIESTTTEEKENQEQHQEEQQQQQPPEEEEESAKREEKTRKHLVTFDDSILQKQQSHSEDSQESNDSPSSSSNTNINNNNNNHDQDLLHSFSTAVGNSLLIDPECASSKPAVEQAMEFTKNYSDDLLMGQAERGAQGQGETHAAGADLADFELPPYSGSSSGSSEVAKQQSPVKAQSSDSSLVSSHSSGLSPPSLTALRDLLKSNYSRVSHIFHWRKPIESGVFFAIGVTLIVALTFFSIISVIAYSTLGLMLASGSIRLYKTVMKTLNRSTETPVDHIWNQVQALNVSMSPEKMHELVDSSLGNFNSSLVYFKQVLLVEDKVATLKFGLFVYFLTYIGAWFNGMTLITIGYLGLFTVPICYEKNKTKIDEFLNLATGQICSLTSMVTSKVSSLVSGSSSTGETKKQN